MCVGGGVAGSGAAVGTDLLPVLNQLVAPAGARTWRVITAAGRRARQGGSAAGRGERSGQGGAQRAGVCSTAAAHKLTALAQYSASSRLRSSVPPSWCSSSASTSSARILSPPPAA